MNFGNFIYSLLELTVNILTKILSANLTSSQFSTISNMTVSSFNSCGSSLDSFRIN